MPIESKKFGDGQGTDNANSKRGCSFQTYDNGCGRTNRPAGHKYCLCIVDSCTRWPAVYLLLKSLTAKTVGEELKNLFMDVGVPSVITSDQGTNFTSSLTKKFLKMFGVTPRFNTPGHPESSGIVERCNQTFKKMIHHVIIDNPRQWHQIIPFTVWAIR